MESRNQSESVLVTDVLFLIECWKGEYDSEILEI